MDDAPRLGSVAFGQLGICLRSCRLNLSSCRPEPPKSLFGICEHSSKQRISSNRTRSRRGGFMRSPPFSARWTLRFGRRKADNPRNEGSRVTKRAGSVPLVRSYPGTAEIPDSDFTHCDLASLGSGAGRSPDSIDPLEEWYLKIVTRAGVAHPSWSCHRYYPCTSIVALNQDRRKLAT
jgi:hypothetical protein